jgi:hypothetical protein
LINHEQDRRIVRVRRGDIAGGRGRDVPLRHLFAATSRHDGAPGAPTGVRGGALRETTRRACRHPSAGRRPPQRQSALSVRASQRCSVFWTSRGPYRQGRRTPYRERTGTRRAPSAARGQGRSRAKARPPAREPHVRPIRVAVHSGDPSAAVNVAVAMQWRFDIALGTR